MSSVIVQVSMKNNINDKELVFHPTLNLEEGDVFNISIDGETIAQLKIVHIRVDR